MPPIEESAGQTNTDTGAGDVGNDTQVGAEGSADTGGSGPEGNENLDTGSSDGSSDGAGDTGAEGAGDTGANGEETGLPESYDFTMPEGMELNKALADAVSPVFKDLGLSQEQASQLTGAYAELMQQQESSRAEAFDKQRNDWHESLESDKDFGGEQFSENCAKVSEFLHATCPDDLKEDFIGMLDQSGLGSHPGVVKYFYSLATRFPTGEDGASGGRPVVAAKATEDRMYPNG